MGNGSFERGLGVVVLPLLIIGQTLRPSTGGRPDPSAHASELLVPASVQNVVYQSQPWTIPSFTEPRTLAGNRPPDTNAATRIPPSHDEYFPGEWWWCVVVSGGVWWCMMDTQDERGLRYEV